MAISREIEHWKDYRSYERPIIRRAGSGRYIDVKISGNDCVLTSGRETKISKSEISDWYECLTCGRINEIAASKGKMIECVHCHGAVVPVGEPFQPFQFSKDIGNGAGRRQYTDAKPIHNSPRSQESAILTDLYADPNSRFQKGGTGYLRVPLDEPRNTRADVPEWLHHRDDYFKTLKASRAARAEQIFCGFYLSDKTDRQIAETLGWRKDSVKKERTVLLRRGNRFFGNLGQPKHPPSPAISEGEETLQGTDRPPPRNNLAASTKTHRNDPQRPCT